MSSLCTVRRLLNWKLLDCFFKRLFSSSKNLGSSSCLTCSTLWITSFKPLCCGPRRSSTTHVTSESLRSGLDAEKLSHIWPAHFRSAHRNWMACWWKDGNPTCRGDRKKAWEDISAGASWCPLVKSPWRRSGIRHQCSTLCQSWNRFVRNKKVTMSSLLSDKGELVWPCTWRLIKVICKNNSIKHKTTTHS